MIALTLLSAAAEGPAPEDVKAGWVAFAVFILLGLAVAFLGWSLSKQLRKAQEAKDRGVYGDELPTPVDPIGDGSSTPGEPTPGEPTPGEPTPGAPTPGEPTSGEPAP